MGARIERLEVGGSPEAWQAAGFTVDDGVCLIGGVWLDIVEDTGRMGIRGWTLSGVELGDRTDIEGIATRTVEAAGPVNPAAVPSGPGSEMGHANGATHIDHLVLITPDLGRTTSTIEAIGPEVRRIRDIGTPETPMQQVFFRLGEVILEIVGPPDKSSDESARWFGIAIDVDDLARPAEVLGDRLGRIKDAVQTGRRIATLRDAPGSLSLAVAFMDDSAEG